MWPILRNSRCDCIIVSHAEYITLTLILDSIEFEPVATTDTISRSINTATLLVEFIKYILNK